MLCSSNRHNNFIEVIPPKLRSEHCSPGRQLSYPPDRMGKLLLRLCKSQGTFLRISLIYDLSPFPSVVLLPRKWSKDCSKDKDFVKLVKDELNNVKRIAKYGHGHLDDDSINSKNYHQNFVSEIWGKSPTITLLISFDINISMDPTCSGIMIIMR